MLGFRLSIVVGLLGGTEREKVIKVGHRKERKGEVGYGGGFVEQGDESVQLWWMV